MIGARPRRGANSWKGNAVSIGMSSEMAQSRQPRACRAHSTTGSSLIRRGLAFYRGKTISFVVPSSAAVSFDTSWGHRSVPRFPSPLVNLPSGNFIWRVKRSLARSVRRTPYSLRRIGSFQQFRSLMSVKGASILGTGQGITEMTMKTVRAIWHLGFRFITGYPTSTSIFQGFLRGDGDMMATTLDKIGPLIAQGQAKPILQVQVSAPGAAF